MMPRKKEKRPFKCEYIPVIVCGIILFLLIAGLIIAILYKIPEPKVKIDGSKSNVDEQLVDSKSISSDQKIYEEMVEKAKKIDVTYQLKRDMIVGYDYPEGYEGDLSVDPPQTEEYAIYTNYFDIFVNNVDPSMYLVFSDSLGVNNEELITIEPGNSKVHFEMAFVDEVMTYTFEVRKAEEPDQGILLRKFSFKTPKYNYFSEMDFCIKYPDNKYCVETTYDNISMTMFDKEVKKVIKKDEDSLYNKSINNDKKDTKDKSEKEKKKPIVDVINDNKVVIIIVIVIIVLGVAATIILTRKKKRSSE